MNSDQLQDAPIMISISFLAFILCRSTVSKPNLARSVLLLEGKLKSRTRFQGVPLGMNSNNNRRILVNVAVGTELVGPALPLGGEGVAPVHVKGGGEQAEARDVA